ncbi:hypothetical protein OYT13_13800 [Pandoraea sp. XJJ-1]|uniref:hypothetical protein n=1 Tax=Pandoraea sp. XJJ-1 TaxID=3002643 RepID=UPI00227EEC47|nr:hypothetical protein [Pandoraea sp. XJJ-1]WAL80950.1 hypothetical protein OYT13_13800 [Pandoraea sp. XJJ-1]
MKKLIFLMLAVTSATAGAKEAYVFPPGQNQVGDVVPSEKLIYVLYTKEKCGLPVVHASDMRRADISGGGRTNQGCWGKTLSGDPDSVIIVDRYGNVTPSSTGNMARATISASGEATVIEPSASLNEFRKRFPGVR